MCVAALEMSKCIMLCNIQRRLTNKSWFGLREAVLKSFQMCNEKSFDKWASIRFDDIARWNRMCDYSDYINSSKLTELDTFNNEVRTNKRAAISLG